MSETLVCPVCRASQPLQPVCRRCSADLNLLIRAMQAVDTSRNQLDQARRSGAPSETIKALRNRLRWLSPKSLSTDDVD